MGVTFPLLIQGSQTAQAYGADKNYIYLVDKNGTIKAIATVPGTSVTYAQIDSAVKSIADKIPALQNSAVRYNQPPKKLLSSERAEIRGNNFTYDIMGRRIIFGKSPMGFMMVVAPNKNAQIPAARILLKRE